MTHTAESIMQVPAFLRSVAPEAIEFYASKCGASVTEIAEAYYNGIEHVVKQVGALIYEAAAMLADSMNNGEA